jgi:hypothetical protein
LIRKTIQAQMIDLRRRGRLFAFIGILAAHAGCGGEQTSLNAETDDLRRCHPKWRCEPHQDMSVDLAIGLDAGNDLAPPPTQDLATPPQDLATQDLASSPQDLASSPDLATDLSPPPPPPDSPTLAGCPVFPSDNSWNQDISTAPVHPNSAAYIASIGSTTAFHPDFSSTNLNAPYGYGIPYVVVPGTQPKVAIEFVDYPDESDPGPYPIPQNVPIEGGPNSTGDRHGLVLDSGSCYLYEVFELRPGSTQWLGAVGAIWHLKENWTRPKYWTSADAAGLPILPGLVRYDEVAAGEIRHALRFTASKTQRGFIAPASHFASSSTDATLPPMGLRVRLKASFNVSTFSPRMQVILRALQRYGMLLADNGSSWFVTGAPDSRWNDSEINTLKALHGSDFEAVMTGPIEH